MSDEINKCNGIDIDTFDSNHIEFTEKIEEH